MKRKNNLMKFACAFLCLLCLAITGAAQKRKTTTKKTGSSTAAAAKAANEANAAEIRSGAEKVSIQIKNVSRFIYLLGSIAQGIEDVDKDIKAGKATKTAADTNAKNKQAVLTTLRNVRAGLVELEMEFRTKTPLRTYLINIQGISDITGVAEDQASAGQLKESGKTLLQVVEKLSDTLVAMP